MSRWESLEEYELDDFSRDVTKISAQMAEIGIRKDKKRPIAKELKEAKSLVSALKERLLEARQRPRPSSKVTANIAFTAEMRISVRKLFLPLQKGSEIGYDEQFTTVLRSLAENFQNAMKTDGAYSNASTSREWVPAEDDYPQTGKSPLAFYEFIF
jgi:hypothetical protein